MGANQQQLMAYGGNMFSLPVSGASLILDSSNAATRFDSVVGGNLVTANNASVKRIEDTSGNGHHCTTSSANVLLKTGTVYGGRDTLFLNSAPLHNTSLVTNLSNYAVMLVVRQTAAVDYAGMISLGASGAGNDAVSTTKSRFAAGYPGIGISYSKNSLGREYGVGWPASFAVHIFNMSGTTSMLAEYYRNGILMPPGNGTTLYNVPSINSDPGYLIGGLWIDGDNPLYRMVGHICEIVIYPKTLIVPEITSLSNYAISKWGIPTALKSYSAYENAYITHHGDGVSKYTWRDTAKTLRAFRVGDLVSVWESCIPGKPDLVNASPNVTIQYDGGVPYVEVGAGTNGFLEATVSWSLTEVAAACSFNSFNQSAYCAWQAGNNTGDTWDRFSDGFSYLGKFRSPRINTFETVATSLNWRTDTLVSNSTEYRLYRNGVSVASATAGFTKAGNLLTVGNDTAHNKGILVAITALLFHSDSTAWSIANSDATSTRATPL